VILQPIDYAVYAWLAIVPRSVTVVAEDAGAFPSLGAETVFVDSP
jgi:hypothetical protein